jgi:RsiW-degrading membrane proteinase PrsW (M82 family)
MFERIIPNHRFTFCENIFLSLVCAGIVYVVALFVVTAGEFLYGFVTNQTQFIVNRYVNEMPSMLLVVTFLCGVLLSLIEKLRYRSQNTDTESGTGK